MYVGREDSAGLCERERIADLLVRGCQAFEYRTGTRGHDQLFAHGYWASDDSVVLRNKMQCVEGRLNDEKPSEGWGSRLNLKDGYSQRSSLIQQEGA